MSTPSVNLKDIAAAALEMVAQLKRDAESAADRLKRQGEESARAVTNALATLEEGLGEMSELMLAASHVFVQRFEMRGSGYSGATNEIPISVDIEGDNQRVRVADGHGRGPVACVIKPGKHKVVLFIIPEDK